MRAAERPFFNLMMFPYPSAEGLHIGNVFAYTGASAGRHSKLTVISEYLALSAVLHE